MWREPELVLFEGSISHFNIPKLSQPLHHQWMQEEASVNPIQNDQWQTWVSENYNTSAPPTDL